ncbi:MAG: hypothetical protein K0R22_1948, partial [Sporomusa sp.]|nr:hypothetical protein [Sporomusa sp.]
MADDNVRSKNSLSFDGPDDSFNPCEAITEAKRCLNCKKPLCR